MLGKVEKEKKRMAYSKVDGLRYSSDECTIGRTEMLGYGQIVMKNATEKRTTMISTSFPCE